MALSQHLSKFNWRLMLVHFFACLFLIHSFRDFYFLNDFKLKMDLLSRFQKNKGIDFKGLPLAIDSMWISHLLLWSILVGYIGLLTGFLISLMISIRHHWYWVNSLIVFIVTFVLIRFGIFNWKYVYYIFQFAEIPFKRTNPWCYITNGAVMLSIGLLLFFLRRSIIFIDKNNNSQI